MNPLDQRWAMVRDRWPLRVKNSSGSVVPPFSVLRIASAAFVNNEKVYTVAKPDTSFQRRYLVSGPFAIGAGSSNEGLATFLSEGGPVQYDGSGTPALDESWGPKAGQWSLSKYRYGFTIEGGNSTGGGNNITLASQSPVIFVYGQTQGAINKGSTSGVVEPYDGNNTILDASTTITVVNRFADVGDDKKVTCLWCGGVWLLEGREKTSQTLLSNMRIKSGDTQIEAEGLAIWVDTTATPAYSDKIPLTSCP